MAGRLGIPKLDRPEVYPTGREVYPTGREVYPTGREVYPTGGDNHTFVPSGRST